MLNINIAEVIERTEVGERKARETLAKLKVEEAREDFIEQTNKAKNLIEKTIVKILSAADLGNYFVEMDCSICLILKDKEPAPVMRDLDLFEKITWDFFEQKGFSVVLINPSYPYEMDMSIRICITW